MKNEFKNLIQQFKNSKKNFESTGPYFWNLVLDNNRVYRNVCVLGGGTSGYLTALAFKKFFNIPVTVIESSKIGPIGVGEATTPLFEDYLFSILELDKKDFYAQVKPTWKLGIKFFWGLPGDYHFNYPFDGKDILSAYVHNKNINYCSLNSFLMSNDSSFVADFGEEQEDYYSFARSLKYALHVENISLLTYLKNQAIARGIEFVDVEIVDATLQENELDSIGELVAKDGARFKYEFYIDCSGFKSLLLEKKLKSPFTSYADSLYNDRAVVSCVPNGGHIKPYTLAESMDNGWCWNIPLRHEDHRGYVFSSSFCSDDQAYEEMLRKNPTMDKDTRIVKFRSGRHEEFIKGNIAAIGNSYAFVEPLESTGLHMIIEEIIVLLNNFLNLKNNHVLRKALNKDMNAHWDYLRYFLSIHFKFNKKFDTPYWKTCRGEINSSGFENIISLYKEIGFLSRQDGVLKNILRNEVRDKIFDFNGVDHILLGQGIVPDNIEDIDLDNKEEWDATVEAWKEITAHTIPIKDDLQVLLDKDWY
jgi:tryptophan halogenase